MVEIKRGEVLKVVDVNKGKVRVALPSGEQKNIQVWADREYPKGTIESLLPLMERVTSRFPGIVGLDSQDFWLNLQEGASLTPQKAVISLRREGYSSRVVGQEIVRRVIKLSGLTPDTKDSGLIQQLVDDASEAVRELYVETTEVRPRPLKR